MLGTSLSAVSAVPASGSAPPSPSATRPRKIGPRVADPLRAGLPIVGGLVAVVVVLAAYVVLKRPGRRRRPGWLIELTAGIDDAELSLIRPHRRLLGAVGYLGFDIAALGATFAATGHSIPVAPLVLGYTIGYLANLIPVPGGFGVMEGGLTGMLIACGAPVTQAAAAVVVYHALAFWIPSLGGLLGYGLLRRQGTELVDRRAEGVRHLALDTPG
jgi:uncharacterized membrane protein YbhN (UPF0104 family)